MWRTPYRYPFGAGIQDVQGTHALTPPDRRSTRRGGGTRNRRSRGQPSQRFGKEGRRRTLAQGSDAIVTAHREIIDLTYYHEKSSEAASETLQIPKATVRTRMFYARKHLAALLKTYGIEHTSA